MTRIALLPLLAVAAAAAVPTASAIAGSSTHAPTVPATKSSIKVEGGYAYYDSFRPLNKREIIVVVKTHGQLPRRFDGLIRAGATLSGHGGGSIGSVGGKASKCYTFSIALKDGRFYPTGDAPAAKGSPGRYTVKMSAKDKDGNTVSSSKPITLRDRRPGDRSGKPLGC
ncbi:hypothetical protein [Conexibacter woesei]|uniref:hypothetical protein n=1 Tax=Conexibacter woesei TaxID=191495 RepID=UPI00041D2A09|nr:hypothetical protein [Conexibacter woesei]